MNLTPGMTWEWCLTGPIDTTVDAQVFITDAFDTPAETVAAIKAKGAQPFCYISAGSWESWRADHTAFPSPLIGNVMGDWPGEHYLDIRQWRKLADLMAARVLMAKAKGFIGVEFDNVDTYSHKTGFPLTPQNQWDYCRLLAAIAHHQRMVVGLKNNLLMIRANARLGTPALLPYFDFALGERLFENDEDGYVMPFTDAKKPVFACEYTDITQWCTDAKKMGISLLQKPEDGIVTSWRRVCG